MKKYTIFLILIIKVLIGASIYANDYKTSMIYSEEEINYIEKLQEEGIKIGANLGSFYIDPHDLEDSLVHKYEKLLESFFQVEVEVVKDEWDDVYQKLKEEEIDLLLNFTLSEKRMDEFNLSIPLYSEKLYVISNNRNISLDSWGDLNGKEIFVLGKSAYSEYLKEFKRKNNLDFKVNELGSSENSSEYEYVVCSAGNLIHQGLNSMELGDVDPIGIGIARNNLMLKKIIDKGLEYSHKEKLLEMLEKEKVKREKSVFYRNLTVAEKKYLEKKEKIEILVDNEFYPVFYYDKDKGSYDGIFFRALNEFSALVGKPIEVINDSPKESWNSMYGRFKKGEGDMTIMYFTPERGSIHSFSVPLEYTDLLLVSNEKKVRDKEEMSGMKIGVVKDDISASIAFEHFFKTNEVVRYESFGDMITALKAGNIHNCVMDNDMLMYYQQIRLDLSLNKIKTIEKLPISFVIQNSNDPLLRVINKSFNGFIDYKKIRSDFFKELSTVKITKELEYKKRKRLILSMITLLTLIVGAMIAGSKYILHKRLHNLAYYDHLTTALNRTSFERDMNQVKFSKDLGLGMYIDLNGFKRINDNYGHHTGDMILKEVVYRLQKTFKENGVYRLAGDEFFIFLKDISLEGGMVLAEQAMEELKNPVNVMKNKFQVSASIGICRLDEKIEDLEEFLHRADIAMYKAKTNEEGAIVIATNELVKQYEEDKALEKELRKAISTEKIIPYFQPKVDLKTGKVNGIEALARWIHSERGVISPGIFIPLAERTGLIPKLDFLIAESTIKKVKSWIEGGHVPRDFKASFNISVKTFEEEEVYEQIKHLLTKYDLSGENIEVEVTENIFINKLTKMLEELKFLKEDLGTSIALDDFTAGHASLRGLGQLTIDTLKFDRSLLKIIKENSEKGKNIYSTLVKLSKDMGYTSVAEGIEYENEMTFLKKEGVDYGQGFYFAKPMPENTFVRYMGERELGLTLEKNLAEVFKPLKKEEEDRVV